MAPSVVPLSVVPNPPSGILGSSVTLNIWGFPERALTYVWYRKSSGSLNQIAAYSVPAGLQTPSDIRERVLPNGSLLIPNLTLSDIGDYIVQIVNFTSGEPLMARGHLSVYGRGNDFLDPGWTFTWIPVLLLPLLLVTLLLLFYIRGMIRRACEHPAEVKSSTSNDSQTCLDSSSNQVDDEPHASKDIHAQRLLAMALSSTTTGIDLDYNEMTGLVLPPSSAPRDFDLPTSQISQVGSFPAPSPAQPHLDPPQRKGGEVPHSALQDCPAELLLFLISRRQGQVG